MDCNEFEKFIYDYFAEPDFDWRLKRKMNAHYFECDRCYNIYRVTKLLFDKELMAEVASEFAKDKSKTFTLPFTIYKNKKFFRELSDLGKDFEPAIELSEKGEYTIFDFERKIMLQESVPLQADESTISGTLHSPALPQTNIITFNHKEGTQKGEMIIRVEKKSDRIILSFKIKKN